MLTGSELEDISTLKVHYDGPKCCMNAVSRDTFKIHSSPIIEVIFCRPVDHYQLNGLLVLQVCACVCFCRLVKVWIPLPVKTVC